MRTRLVLYGIAILMVVPALVVGRALFPITGLITMLMLVPVVVVSYIAGRGPALLTTLIVIAWSAWLAAPHEVVGIILLGVNGALVSILGGMLHGVRARLREGERAEHMEKLARIRSDAQFATIFDASPLPSVLVRDRDLVFVAVNEAYLAAFGYAREKLIGKPTNVIDFYPYPEERDQMIECMRRDGSVRNMEIHGRGSNGDIRTLLASVELVTLDNERHHLAVVNDITAQRASEDRSATAERALQISEERFATAFAASPLASAIVRTSDHRFVAVNDELVRLLGYSRDELLSTSSDEMAFWLDPEERAKAHAKVATDGRLRGYEATWRTKDGRSVDISWSVEHIDLAGEPSMLGVLQDITDQKRIAHAMRDSEQRFRDLADNIREVFWIVDPYVQKVLYVSPAYETIWGRCAQDLYERPLDWLEAIHVDDRARVQEAAARHGVTGEYEEQYRIVRPDRSVRWIRDRGFAVRDERGVIIRLAGVAEDVTEELRLQDQLRQTQKMESLGMLAGGVAHDFNNILTIISSSNGLLADEMAKDDPNRELVDEIDSAVSRATGLTRQLLAFSRKQVVEPKVLDLNAAVHETRKMLRRMVGEDIILTTSLEPELGRVRVDPGYLVQVLMNLAVNARDAMPKGGSLALTTRNVVIGDQLLARHPGETAGPAVLLEVTDTGTGIPTEVMAHIFEPFFTTKEHGKGTGMGLAVVHGIIEQAGGFIDVDSTPGIGATFRIYLPAVAQEAQSTHQINGALAFGAETILLVDDDDHVRRTAARALRSRGYTVYEAGGGAVALEQLADTRSFDLLLTDVVMPGMDGRQLAEAARGRCPSLKVLYTSGYTDDAVVRHGVMQGEVELIEKPFRIDALASKVRQVLDQDCEIRSRSAESAA